MSLMDPLGFVCFSIIDGLMEEHSKSGVSTLSDAIEIESSSFRIALMACLSEGCSIFPTLISPFLMSGDIADTLSSIARVELPGP